MSENDRDLANTLRALTSRGCHVNRDWLSDCVNFFRSENNQYSAKDLENFVFEQWLLGDLREIASCGSLPPNLNEIPKIMLGGKMACQIESFTDIGHSAYNQMQKVRNEDVGNLLVDDNKEFQQAWEPKSNRCLQLTLCDGVQTIKAIEYKPIRSLKTDMMPGIKILLQGPLECRRGILLLEEKHITLLGGEVDAFVIVNAYENLLARKLNLPENPDPYNLTAPPVAQQTQPQVQPQPQAPQQRQQQHPAAQANNSNHAPQRPPPVNNSNSRRGQNQPPPGRASEQPKKLVQTSISWTKQPSKPAQVNPSRAPSDDFFGNDEDFMNIPLDAADWDEEMEFESAPAGGNFNTCRKPEEGDSLPGTNTATWGARNIDRPTSAASSTAVFDDLDEAILLEASLAAQAFEQNKNVPVVQRKASEETSSTKRLASTALPSPGISRKKPLFSKAKKETSSQEVSSSTDLNFMGGDEFLDFDDPPETSKLTPMSLPSQPFVYLSQINQSKTFSTFRVKAAVITVIEKLSISQNEWKLSAKISDGSANVDVKFSNKVLEELFGMSATTMTEMKKQVAQQPEKKEIIRKKLEKAQCRLINLNCLLDLKMSDAELPLVVGVEDISSSTVSALNKRDTLSKS